MWKTKNVKPTDDLAIRMSGITNQNVKVACAHFSVLFCFFFKYSGRNATGQHQGPPLPPPLTLGGPIDKTENNVSSI